MLRPGNVGKMGVINPGTDLASCLFADIGETVAAAQIWDPSMRPIPNPTSEQAVGQFGLIGKI